MDTPKKNQTKPDPNTTPKSTPKKDITNCEYYDGHDAESENASVESLSSTDSYVEVELPSPKGKQKQDSTSENDMSDSFVTVKSGHAEKGGGGKSKEVGKKGGDGDLRDVKGLGVEKGG